MTAPSISSRAWLELGVLALVWGTTFFSIAIAQREVGPVTVVLHRVFWGAVFLWLIVWARGLRVPLDRGTWVAFLVMGCLNNVIPFTLMSWGQTQIETGLVSIFNAMTAPLGVLVAALCLSDERLTLARAFGVVLAFSGAVLIIGPSRLGALDLRALGQWAVMAGALSYAFAGVWGKLRMRGVDPVVAAAGMLAASTVLMVPLAVAFEGAPSLSLTLPTWVAIAHVAIVCTAGAYLLYYRVLGMAGAGNLLLVTLLIPPVAIGLGAGFLGETLASRAYAGFLLIAIGLLVIDGRVLRLIRREAV